MKTWPKIPTIYGLIEKRSRSPMFRWRTEARVNARGKTGEARANSLACMYVHTYVEYSTVASENVNRTYAYVCTEVDTVA